MPDAAARYVLLDARNPYFTDLAAAIESRADDAGLSLFLCNSMNSQHREAAYLNRLQQQRVQGILVTPLDTEHPLLGDIQRRGTPVVLVDRAPRRDTHCSVSVDNVRGGELAAEHLLDLGHQRLAFAGGPTTLGQVQHRLRGVRRAMHRRDLPPGALTALTEAGMTIDAGRTVLDQICEIPQSKRPTAIVCGNDLVALGVLQQCVQRSIDVPGDLAIVGYDDIEFAAAAAISLTSVRQPRQQLGERAAELVMQEADDQPHEHIRTSFLPDLVVRQSTSLV